MCKKISRTLLIVIAAAAAILLPLRSKADNGGRHLKLKAHAIEGMTNQPLKQAAGVIVDYLTRDTIAIGTRSMAYEGSNMDLFVSLTFEIPRIPGKYLLEIYAPQHDTLYREVNIEYIGRRETSRILEDFILYRTQTRSLDEVAVTATKVKFYHNGDTLIFNADAFKLPEGSMLDALVKQLPGVELREGGVIYVNDKKVESLLLNGKDFFVGDNNIMLNNLGAYTVKNVAVYEKLGDKSLLAGRNLGDSQYVMDVRLKREYMSGYMGNVVGGGGTSSRYLTRLFGMWYTNRSRLTFVGNLNNLNDSRTPGQNDGWKSSSVPGDIRTKMAGLDYNVHNPDNKWEFKGNTRAIHIRSNDITTTDKTNFVPGGDIYGHSFADALSHNLVISTDNTFTIRDKRRYMRINQNLEYRKNDFASSSLSGTFNSEIKNLTRQLLEEIYSGIPTSISDMTVNTALIEKTSTGSVFDAKGFIATSIRPAYSPDLIGLSVSGGYLTRHYDNFNLYDIRYNSVQSSKQDYQYIKNHPDRAWDITVSGHYDYIPTPEISVDITPSWIHKDAKISSYLYDLDRLEDMGVFGVLPECYQSVLNKDETYYSLEKSDGTRIEVTLTGEHEMNDGASIRYQLSPSLQYIRRSLDYARSATLWHVARNNVDFEMPYSYVSYRKGKNSYQLIYTRSITPAALSDQVDIVDNRDPLNIFVGSQSLKNSASNAITLEWNHNRRERHKLSNLMRIHANIIENDITKSYRYDPQTGVKTFMSKNIKGNWEGKIYNGLYKAFGSKDQFDFYSNSNLSFIKMSDMRAIGDQPFTKTAVKNIMLGQSILASWKIGRQKLSLNGGITWRDTWSNDAGFISFSATTAQYGVSGQFTLPYNFSISTDLTIYSRRGYNLQSLNTTDMVWNARVAYSIKGGRWLVSIDGFDLLHQLSNVTYNVNAQGRMEIRNNVLPRYALLHIQYRFMYQPKKK